MANDPKKPQPETNWAGELELEAVRLQSPDQGGNFTVTVSANAFGLLFQGLCKQIVQMRNGNLRVAIEPNGKPGTLRHIILTPPYRADMKE